MHHVNHSAKGMELERLDKSSKLPWLAPVLEIRLRSLLSSMYGFKQPKGRRQSAQRGSGFLQDGQHDSTGFCLDSQPLAIFSCRLSLESGSEVLQ
mmetsp:Transcript_7072/g.19765  ORF Transcript_7072/g.19765 Transcript_7072/m.19765 type:complete len:95 (+) Transcript_7072:211-495(+)